MPTCLRCDRTLTNPQSIAAKYGQICLARIRAAERGQQESESPDACAKLVWDPETMDVICRRASDPRQFTEKAFNIPHTLVQHSPTGMEWGYAGSGPADFALNILYWFTEDREFSERWHQEFKFEFVAGLPRMGGRIPGGQIRDWIAERRAVAHSQMDMEAELCWG